MEKKSGRERKEKKEGQKRKKRERGRGRGGYLLSFHTHKFNFVSGQNYLKGGGGGVIIEDMEGVGRGRSVI